MANISNIIEQFLLSTLGNENSLELSRNELASYFSCAPSQINYVLATRFTPDRGYTIVSKRGGGGSIRVMRVTDDYRELFNDILNTPVTAGISYTKACGILDRLAQGKIITAREAALLKTVLTDKALIAPTLSKDSLRAGILRAVVSGGII